MVLAEIMEKLAPLSVQEKLALLSALSESLKADFNENKKVDKDKIMNELFGSWSDVDDSVIDEIYNSRTSSNKDINFD